ncbi:MAG: 50S ribosomal protein L35 [Mycoplasmataceae bacterium CE_OT135]|nr:MAG: 50S ribosomal protein L35 [Mycoplasmataceae bacterium CE_OT135]
MVVKLKTKKAFHKRFKGTASGNLKRERAFTSHLFGNKSTKQKRHLRKASLLAKSDLKRARKMINYKSI